MGHMFENSEVARLKLLADIPISAWVFFDKSHSRNLFDLFAVLSILRVEVMEQGMHCQCFAPAAVLP